MKKLLIVVIVGAITWYWSAYQKKEEIKDQMEGAASELESIISEQNEAESWEEMEASNKRIEVFNQKIKDELDLFFNAPHILNATGEIATYRDLMKEEMAIIDLSEPRSRQIEQIARRFESRDMDAYAAEDPEGLQATLVNFCKLLTRQAGDMQRHLDIGTQRLELLRDPQVFEGLFQGQAEQADTVTAVERIVATRQTVYDSWQTTLAASECEQFYVPGPDTGQELMLETYKGN